MPNGKTEFELDALIDDLDARVTESELAVSENTGAYSQVCSIVICNTVVICS
ncbi:hypothetical protein [Streptomyces albus]|uniref:hypothetical protein n=1 Tax=Streptomyces albus TaxID=1888 RepID=UPI000AEF5DFD|nr:hypothetical protein [Streptomyces albus]